MKNEIQSIKKKILPILKKNGVMRAGIFGSYARGEQTENSDIDILVEFEGKKSLLDLAGLKIEIEDSTNREVDILTYKSLHHLLKKIILNEEVQIL